MMPSSLLKAVERQTEQTWPAIASKSARFFNKRVFFAPCRPAAFFFARTKKKMAQSQNRSSTETKKRLTFPFSPMPLARLIAVAALASLSKPAFALEAECSACEVVAVGV